MSDADALRADEGLSAALAQAYRDRPQPTRDELIADEDRRAAEYLPQLPEDDD